MFGFIKIKIIKYIKKILLYAIFVSFLLKTGSL